MVDLNHDTLITWYDKNNNKTSSKGDRSSCDDKTNILGRKLLNICHNHNIPGDRLGNFTCFNNPVAGIVDYFLADSNIWQKIIEFKVLDPNFDSKHVCTNYGYSQILYK